MILKFATFCKFDTTHHLPVYLLRGIRSIIKKTKFEYRVAPDDSMLVVEIFDKRLFDASLYRSNMRFKIEDHTEGIVEGQIYNDIDDERAMKTGNELDNK